MSDQDRLDSDQVRSWVTSMGGFALDHIVARPMMSLVVLPLETMKVRWQKQSEPRCTRGNGVWIIKEDTRWRASYLKISIVKVGAATKQAYSAPWQESRKKSFRWYSRLSFSWQYKLMHIWTHYNLFLSKNVKLYDFGY